MAKIDLDIRNYDTNVPMQDYDILCIEKVQNAGRTIACSFVTIEMLDQSDLYRLKIKFEWLEYEEELEEKDFLFITETNLLFFCSTYQWGIIDVKSKSLVRHEEALYRPFISKESNFILIYDELEVESVKYNGETIDKVPVDPPYDMKVLDGRIEFTSDVYGYQVLKTQ